MAQFKKQVRKKMMAKGGPVTTDELITMKALRLAGLNDSEIAEQTERNNHTVGRCLNEFENLLPYYPEFRDKIKASVKELAEEASYKMKYVADLALIQIVKTLGDANARDSAIVMKILHDTAGSINPEVLLGAVKEGGGNIENVQFVLQQIINMQTNNYDKNERTNVDSDPQAAATGPTSDIKGNVQEGSVLPS